MAEITLGTDLSELATLAAFVDRFAADAALSEEVAFQLSLVLEELVTNAITHGAARGAIELRLERQSEAVKVDLIDTGAAFDPRSVPPPALDAPLEERHVGGLGVYLVRQFVDEIDYRREDGRNHLRLCKRLTPRRAPGAGGQ
jgi:anti-sigma regulatory factor (Ser/Thr protein kinase)